eukprot:CAMPEP_0177609962 /NCGR_PEP_ID=MMETSP0419_2-20121207/19455_1 /TAXON_ID=582737 /ORGANISM="Tetraselmis sp., Strain GSL018" /LENGTH=147 /DNA_ID=CAMNT_0019105095 /DNA_START=227 /DNA_END=670 /DNA_ORIENTATION=-
MQTLPLNRCSPLDGQSGGGKGARIAREGGKAAGGEGERGVRGGDGGRRHSQVGDKPRRLGREDPDLGRPRVGAAAGVVAQEAGEQRFLPWAAVADGARSGGLGKMSHGREKAPARAIAEHLSPTPLSALPVGCADFRLGLVPNFGQL